MYLAMAILMTSAAPAPSAQTFDLQGHRGARGLCPENTLVAFAKALSLGVATLELDAAVTKDGVVVVSHDPHVNPDLARGPDGKWIPSPGPAIFSLTAAEVKRYDVGRLRPGSSYAASFPDQVPVDGTRFATLREVFALAKKAGNENVRFNVETKIRPDRPDDTVGPEAFAEAIVTVARAAGVTSRTTIQSFDWRTLQHVQKTWPDMVTVYLTEPSSVAAAPGSKGVSPWLAGFDPAAHGGSIPRTVAAAGGRVWSPNQGQVTRESLAEAHGLGLKVIPWTVNRPEDMAALIDLGVDGLITDRPDVARTVIASKGLVLPAPTPVEP
jgi:glycerophosphoryl diester phosphodiesterase